MGAVPAGGAGGFADGSTGCFGYRRIARVDWQGHAEHSDRRIACGMGGVDGPGVVDSLRVMLTLKTTGRVNARRTLAVRVPRCGVAAGEYEVLVMLNESPEPAEEGFQQWLERAAGSAAPGVTTDALMAASRGED